MDLLFFVENLPEDIDSYVSAGIVAVLAAIGVKVKKGFSLKQKVSESIELADNLSELSKQSISEIVAEQLQEFHSQDPCHQRMENCLRELVAGQKTIMDENHQINQRIAHIEGQLGQTKAGSRWLGRG